MTKRLSPVCMGLLMVLAIGLFSSPAFANSTVWAKNCNVDGTFSGIFCSLSTEFRFIPKALALLAYASGVALFFIGLLNLKNYGDDPSQTSFRDVIMKFVLGAFLISLPFAMNVIVGTVTGKGGITLQDQTVRRPCLAHGSSLDAGMAGSAACK